MTNLTFETFQQLTKEVGGINRKICQHCEIALFQQVANLNLRFF